MTYEIDGTTYTVERHEEYENLTGKDRRLAGWIITRTTDGMQIWTLRRTRERVESMVGYLPAVTPN